MASDDLVLPHPDELKVTDIAISTPLFRVLSRYMAFECDKICLEYELCRTEEKDPRNCLKEGKKVTACGLKFAQEVKKTCRDEAEAFARCMDWNSFDLNFDFCRREEKIFDSCMKHKMGKEKPPFGYFTQVRIHQSERARPLPAVPEWPDKTRGIPEDHPALKELPRHGSRYYWYP